MVVTHRGHFRGYIKRRMSEYEKVELQLRRSTREIDERTDITTLINWGMNIENGYRQVTGWVGICMFGNGA